MTSAVSVKLVGFQALDNRLSDLPDKIERKVFRDSLRATGKKIARRLKDATVKVSGDARRSVKVKVKVRQGGAFARVGYTKRQKMQMRVRDQGAPAHGQPARPFFIDAVSPWEVDAIDAFADSLEKAVEKQEGLI